MEVDPAAELSGVYRHVGAGGTVMRPTPVDAGPYITLGMCYATHPDTGLSDVTIPGLRCHSLDPSSSPDYSPSIPDVGVSCKTIFDCTVPFHLKNRFKRAPFLDVDPERWLHG